MKATVVRPLLSVVYLAKASNYVFLVVPWQESPEDECIMHTNGTLFSSREKQPRFM